MINEEMRERFARGEQVSHHIEWWATKKAL